MMIGAFHRSCVLKNTLRNLTKTSYSCFSSSTANQNSPNTNSSRELNDEKRISSNEKRVPSHAEIVIAGGGLIGNSVAYHLTKCGWKDVLLLEQGQAGCGTSWHGAGLCGSVKGSKTQAEMALYGIDLYSRFEEETGVATGFKRCGSLYLATTKEREIALKRNAAFSRQYGVECHVIGPKEAQELNPLLNVDDVRMALWAPKDGVVNPTDLIQAYLKGSTKHGATKFMEGVTVTGFENDTNSITGVHTSHGYVTCDKFINCTGLWAWELGQKSNPRVSIPLHACEHYLIITKAMEGVDPMLPVTRDYDRYTYIREWSGGLLAGGFEPDARGTFFKGIPKGFEFQLLEEDYDHFSILMDGLLHRYSCFEHAEIRQFTNGPESFTADGLPHVSKSADFRNYYIAAGLNSNGIINSAGVGRAMSELITYGESATNINNFNLSRISSSANNKMLCHDKAASTLSVQYALNYPRMTSNGKSAKNSPIHFLLDQHGAVWSSSSDWSKPYYFKRSKTDRHIDSFGKPSWLSNVQFELENSNKFASIFDFSSKAKFNISFKNKAQLTDFVNSISLEKKFDKSKNKSYSSAIITNPQGSVLCSTDILVRSATSLTLTTDANQHTYLHSYLKDKLINQTDDVSSHNVIYDEVTVEDCTGRYAIFGLTGPKACDVINELLNPPYSLDSIQDNYFMEVDIGYACNVLLVRSFLQGIDGWQLIVPTEYSQGLYSMILKDGEKYGLCNNGTISLDSLRAQHMVPAYGSAISFGSNMNVAKDLYSKKEEKDSNISLTQIQFQVTNSENWAWGGEQIATCDKGIIGNITTIGYTGEDDVMCSLALLDRTAAKIGDSVRVIVGEDSYEGIITGQS